MRLVLRGPSSFIAQHVARVANEAGIEVLALDRTAALNETLNADDVVINFALTPEYRSAAYRPEFDQDLLTAEAASKVGARCVLLSSRRVYPPSERWSAVERGPTAGDETPYGRNKAATEKAVLDLTQGDATVLRLSNVFGMEYGGGRSRGTFFGRMLQDLRSSGTIRFDMAAQTRRDFIPVDDAAAAIVKIASAGREGIYNLGSGLPISCGQVAQWVISGYGSGAFLEPEAAQIRDEFYLDMTKWVSEFELPTNSHRLQMTCNMIGLWLRDA